MPEQEQAALFPNTAVPDEFSGYRGPTACQAARITYRQLDYWARTDLVVPTVRGAKGSGSQRLYSDGTPVYECASPEEIVDLLQGGQGVFGIAVGGTMREITGSLAEFPVERVDGDRVVPVEPDELAQRRQARTAG